ncbi:MAG TPA: glycosyltransferase [Acidimicrobiales bacterium]
MTSVGAGHGVITEVALDTIALDRFEPLIGHDREDSLCAAADRARAVMTGRTFWHVNSTAKGGGVAELLTALLPYLRGAGIDTRWLVIDGDADFFTVSKRIHNQLHESDGEPLGDESRRTYEHTLARNADGLRALVQPGDVVLFHDPQTAGLIDAAKACGARIAWRCHIGVDEPDGRARAAWAFLGSYIAAADRLVFSCRQHVWDGLDAERVTIMPPSIDAFTPKNEELDESTAAAILAAAGIVDAPPELNAKPEFMNRHGVTRMVTRRATVTSGSIPYGAPIVVQVSRWDDLKDPIGVLRGFVDHVAPHHDAHLVLAGPAADSIEDDPEQVRTLADVHAAWEQVEPFVRRRVHLVSLPMDDEDENAAMVNALQRRADVVVQKSLAEGFGLTVAEAMWKRRAVVASDRGGIVEQITDNENGVLVHDPSDLAEFGRAVSRLLEDQQLASRLGEAAHERVRDYFLAPRELVQYFELTEQLVEG